MTSYDLKIVSKLDKYSGIYMIYNSENNKMYIGSSVNIYKRVQHDHINDLSKNKHYNKYLQRAYNKYKDSFKYFILEKVDDKAILAEREQYWLDFYGSYNQEKGYNLAPTAQSMIGFRHSEETKRKISEVQIGRKHSLETRLKRSESLKGENCYWYGKKLTVEHIEKIQSTRGKYEVTDETKNKISETLKGRKKPKETMKKLHLSNMKPVIQMDLDGKIISTWESITIASKYLKINKSNISSVCKGSRNIAGGFKWAFKEDVLGVN